jgi:hypothetical protein
MKDRPGTCDEALSVSPSTMGRSGLEGAVKSTWIVYLTMRFLLRKHEYHKRSASMSRRARCGDGPAAGEIRLHRCQPR